ncbi:hypothetical protein DER45DRAFT_548215 [Fusarium avenaceum]|nr:hypothetical protein DER45DRAFT_548215 [Fusarium avenaceum]
MVTFLATAVTQRINLLWVVFLTRFLGLSPPYKCGGTPLIPAVLDRFILHNKCDPSLVWSLFQFDRCFVPRLNNARRLQLPQARSQGACLLLVAVYSRN